MRLIVTTATLLFILQGPFAKEEEGSRIWGSLFINISLHESQVDRESYTSSSVCFVPIVFLVVFILLIYGKLFIKNLLILGEREHGSWIILPGNRSGVNAFSGLRVCNPNWFKREGRKESRPYSMRAEVKPSQRTVKSLDLSFMFKGELWEWGEVISGILSPTRLSRIKLSIGWFIDWLSLSMSIAILRNSRKIDPNFVGGLLILLLFSIRISLDQNVYVIREIKKEIKKM